MDPITVTRVVHADIATVWDIFTDLPNAADRLSAVTSIEVLSDGPFAVGTRWRETRQMFGRSATEEMWVTEVVPAQSYTVEAEGMGMKYLSTYRFQTHPEGTQVTFEFGADVQGTMAKILAKATGWIAKGILEKQLRADLDDLATASEQ